MSNDSQINLARLHAETVGHPRLLTALADARAAGAAFVCASGNAGDGLIHLGAFNLLEGIGWSPRIIGEAAIAAEPDGASVVIVGGAMIEGIWEERMRALRAFLERGGHVVFLPCTIAGFSEILSAHRDRVTIFAREQATLDQARSAGVTRAWLCHDLAFAVSPEFYVGLLHGERYGTLVAYRTDHERARDEIPVGNLDLSFLWNGALWMNRALVAERCRMLGRILASFETVCTDRLHIAIFAAALGCRVKLATSIGSKIPGVYRQSLQCFPLVTLEETPPSGASGEWTPRDALVEQTRELARLRREWYEPELERRRIAAEDARTALEEIQHSEEASRAEIARLEGLVHEWYEPELERRRIAAEDARTTLEEVRSVEVAARKRAEAWGAEAKAERSALLRQVARHRHQTIFYAEQSVRNLRRVQELEAKVTSQADRIRDLESTLSLQAELEQTCADLRKDADAWRLFVSSRSYYIVKLYIGLYGLPVVGVFFRMLRRAAGGLHRGVLGASGRKT